MTRLSTATLLAAERAIDLGAELVRRGRSHYGAMIDKGDRDYATAVDVEIERAIREVLREADTDIAFLGEEEGLSPAEADAVWVLDPIDGTINFSKASPLCGISLALIEGGRPTLGIVDLPLLGERYVAREGMGAFMNGRPISVSEVDGLRQAVVGFADFAVGAGSASENALHLEIMRRLALREPADPGPRLGQPRPRLAECRTPQRHADALQPALGRQRRRPPRARGRRRGLRPRRLAVFGRLDIHHCLDP